MPAEGRLHRLADFVELQRVHRALEFRHRVTRVDPAEIAAAAAARIDRMQAGERAEFDLARFDAQLESPRAGA